MPTLDGISATRRIAETDPSLPVVMLDLSGREDEVLAAVQAGAIGFLSKSLSPNSLIRGPRDFDTTGARPMSRIMAGRCSDFYALCLPRCR